MLNIILAASAGIFTALLMLLSSGVSLQEALISCGLGALILAGFVYTFRKRLSK